MRATLPPAARDALEHAAESEPSQWHLLVLPLGDYPKLVSFDSPEELREQLKTYVGTDVMTFIFYGQRGFVSDTAPLHYLLLPDGNAMPLFDLPTLPMMQPTEFGFLGQKQHALAPVEEEPAAEAAVETEAEEAETELPAEDDERDDDQEPDENAGAWSGEPVDAVETEEPPEDESPDPDTAAP